MFCADVPMSEYSQVVTLANAPVPVPRLNMDACEDELLSNGYVSPALSPTSLALKAGEVIICDPVAIPDPMSSPTRSQADDDEDPFMKMIRIANEQARDVHAAADAAPRHKHSSKKSHGKKEKKSK